MRRIFSAVVSIFSLFLITVILTAYYTLDRGPYQGQDFLIKIYQGHVYLFFFIKSTWANYPSFNSFQAVIHIPTLLYSGFLILCMCYFLRYKRKWRLIYIGLLCMAIGLISYLIRLQILLNQGIDHNPYSANPGTWGRYSVIMFIELFYSSVACAVFAFIDIFTANTNREVSKNTRLIPGIRSLSG